MKEYKQTILLNTKPFDLFAKCILRNSKLHNVFAIVIFLVFLQQNLFDVWIFSSNYIPQKCDQYSDNKDLSVHGDNTSTSKTNFVKV